MRDLGDELRNAESRYYIGQLAAVFFLGTFAGSLIGWILWG
jgi:hypothetical protein|tara:strand:- start:4245 stop:4367 length:123 start_codon:yes stop_codon:yes gene_type:complete